MPSEPCRCGAESWLWRTHNNTSDRRVVLVDGWRGVGIGHSLQGVAFALQLLLHSDRSIRLAFCIPDALRKPYQGFKRPVPRCEDTGLFDLSRHIALEGLPNFAASHDDLVPSGPRALHRSPTGCEHIRRLLASSERHLIFHHLEAKEAIRCAGPSLRSRHGLGVFSPCLRRMRLVAPSPPLPPCDVGLHLRTLRVDDPRCNVLLTPEAADCPLHGTRKQLERGSCAGAEQRRWPDGLLGGCPGTSRFATSDDAGMFAATRRFAWADLNETPALTWTPRDRREREVQPPTSPALTVAAWAALARCSGSIVAPIRSRFSVTAALAAGVPLMGCCAEAASHAAITKRFGAKAWGRRLGGVL